MPEGGQLAARIRAAHAYSGLKRDDFASTIGISGRQLTRLESGDVRPDRDICHLIADAAGVPRAFMDVGFAPLRAPISDADRRIYLIEQKVAELGERLQPERLIETFRPVLEADGRDEQRGQSKPRTARRAKGRPPTAGGGAGA